jgi:hypothetical protein
MYYLPYWPYWRYFQQSPSIPVVGRVSYCQEVPYVLPYWPYWGYFQQSSSILVSRNDPSCVCRCQYNFFFRELFLAAHFSRKFEKPSYGSEGSFLTLRTNDIVHFATYLLSKIVLYIIYVIICTYMGINWHRRQTTDHGRRHTLNLSYYLMYKRGFARSMMVGTNFYW